MTEWISCADRLPNAGEKVFTLAKAKDIVAVDIYHEGHGFFPSKMYGNDVTHWMPIPKEKER